MEAKSSNVEHGETDRVLENRHVTQGIMKQEAIAAVEAGTGREVLACMSANHVDPDMAAEVFVLVPRT